MNKLFERGKLIDYVALIQKALVLCRLVLYFRHFVNYCINISPGFHLLLSSFLKQFLLF
jgi:hypothetical protein